MHQCINVVQVPRRNRGINNGINNAAIAQNKWQAVNNNITAHQQSFASTVITAQHRSRQASGGITAAVSAIIVINNNNNAPGITASGRQVLLSNVPA